MDITKINITILGKESEIEEIIHRVYCDERFNENDACILLLKLTLQVFEKRKTGHITEVSANQEINEFAGIGNSTLKISAGKHSQITLLT